MKHYLTYDELMAFALKHYNEGGDITYECLDEATFNEHHTHLTEEDALKMFEFKDSIRREYQNIF